MPARTTQHTRSIEDLDSLPAAISKIFDQAQVTTANHQKNFVALYKLQTDSAEFTESVQNGKSLKLTGERAFEDVILDMLARVLPVKKGVTVADRIMKFVGGYVKFINDKAIEERKAKGLEEDEDLTASRFVARVLKFLVKGCLAKDKVVRFRVVQCMADMVVHLGDLDEDLYVAMRSMLMERARDKEPPIRVQAILALSKLAPSESLSDLKGDEESITEVMIDTMAFDTSAEVRRAALVNLQLNKETLKAVLPRTRDVDTTIRRLIYTTVLEKNCLLDDGTVGLTHPRALTIAQRELIVRNGLGDREEAVKGAAAKLVAMWVDVVRDNTTKHEDDDEGIMGDLVAFLKLFYLMDFKVAEDALTSVFRTRVDIFDNIQFGDNFWKELTPEKAFLARVFVDHGVAVKDDSRLESALPVVTALAFHIQSAYNDLLEHMQAQDEERLLRGGFDDDDDALEAKETERGDREFIIGEMLKIAANLDYADEIGRRKMFQLVRDMISQDVLPENMLERCLDVLRILSPNERDLIRLVVEVIHELRDPDIEEEPQKDINDGETDFAATPATVRTARAPPKPESEMSPEEKARADMVDLRCLSLCIGMLERVNGTFEENSTLEGILGELIIPAVKRKELILREKGLVALGLCCLIARRMALSSFQLFLGQVQTAPEVLKIRVLQIIFDILMIQEGDFLSPESANAERIVEFLLHQLENSDSDKVQALLCMGFSKLMLSGMVTDDRVLRSLMLIYITPETIANQELRQCLSYFFPVYCYSSPVNQRRMQKICVSLYEQIAKVYRDWDGDEEMVTPAQVGLMFIDWTDPQKAAAVTKDMPGLSADDTIHLDLAGDIVKALFNRDLEKDDVKGLCQMLGKLHIPDTVDDNKIRALKLLTHNLRSRRPLRDTSAQNAFIKFDMALSKKYAAQLEGFSEDEYRQLEYLTELFEFLDGIRDDEDDEDEDVKILEPRRRKRPSGSITTTTSGGSAAGSGDEDGTPTARKPNGKGKAKRRRLSQSDEEAEDDRTETGSVASAVQPRAVPRRSAAEKSRMAVAEMVTPKKEEPDSDSDIADVTPMPAAKQRKPAAGRSARPPSPPISIHDTTTDDEEEEAPRRRKPAAKVKPAPKAKAKAALAKKSSRREPSPPIEIHDTTDEETGAVNISYAVDSGDEEDEEEIEDLL